MKLLFNKNDQGAEELKKITSSYYANNQFEKILAQINFATEGIIEIIGKSVYDKAVEHYYSAGFNKQNNPNEALDELVQKIRTPIAYNAQIAFHQLNILSHEDSGRKIKLNNENEKMPWEWMFDRDDEAHQRQANLSLDRLISFLDQSDLQEWLNSDQKKLTRRLFISNAKAFGKVFPIDDSGMFFQKVTSFIDEVQRTKIRPALGKEKYEELLTYYQGSAVIDEDLETLLAFVQNAIPMLTMVIAIDRLNISVLPYGLVQQFKSMMQSRNASQAALDETVRKFRLRFERSASRSLDELKQYLNGLVNYDDYPLLPDNDDDQKFFRT